MICHLDADCFYVSAERVRRPALRSLPVGVLGNQGACCIAKSYEMKACGVKTGEPIWDAVKKCPDGVFIKRDFEWYEVLSRLMLETVQRVSPTVEYYSVDEFFFEADPQAAKRLQADILGLGLPVSIGVAMSRTLAKLASDLSKPFGFEVITDPAVFDGNPVDDLTGIATRSAIKLAAHGIRTCGDFRRADAKLINKLLTKKGEALWHELNGQPCVPIQTVRPQHKAIGRGGSIGQASDDPRILTAWLVRNMERLVEAMAANGYVASRLMLSVEYKDGGGFCDRTSLPQATSSSEVMLPAAKFMFWRRPRGVVSHIHLLADKLERAGRRQLTFADRPQRIDAIKALVNDKLGRWSVRSGETLPIGELYSDPAHAYEICDIQGKTCF
jgi:nucleotidyltransferase/DNA polymerase involved in DNA repair